MRIVKFIGGLGNQMFQYAFLKALKYHNPGVILADLRNYKYISIHNGFELCRLFNLKPDYTIWSFHWYDIVNKLTGKKEYIREKEQEVGIFHSSYLTNKNNAVYEGFWQSEKYFQSIENIIRDDFRFKLPLTEKNQSLMEIIRTTNSVSIHVRRGDYLDFFNTQGICTLEYYQESINRMKLMGDNVLFFIFSNDIDWCKKNLPVDSNSYFVDWNLGVDSYVDMQLMSNCKHNIIANSTFSWWGAWLNSNPEKVVIAPSKWFQDGEYPDLVPESWIRI